jgi:hypothetical protein
MEAAFHAFIAPVCSDTQCPTMNEDRKPTGHDPGSAPAGRLYPCTNCGMVPLSQDGARGKLRARAAGAAIARAET